MAAKKKPTDVVVNRDRAAVAKKSPAQVRVFTDWTPLMLRNAERQAESGNLGPAAAICEWIMGDDGVSAPLSARVEQLMGLEPTFEAGTGKRAGAAAKALEADEDWWESYPESELTQLHKWGLVLGIGPAHHDWEQRDDHGGRMLPQPSFWHPYTLRYDWKTHAWGIRDSENTELPVVAGDGEWILHTPYGAQRPWSLGLWRCLARLVLLKQLAIGDWARHSEKGSLLVATSEQSNETQRRELAQDLQAAGSDPVVALPDGFDLKLVEVTANTQSIYDAQIKMANEAIATVIRGGNLTTNVKGGSRAAAETQKKTGDDAKLRFDAQSLTSTIHDQSLVWWAEFNFGDPRLAPWPVYPVAPEEDLGDYANMLDKLTTSLERLDKLGYAFDDNELKTRFRLTFVTSRVRETRVDQPSTTGKPGEKTPVPKQPKALASGATEGVAGYLNGQGYADNIVDAATQATAEAMAHGLADVLRVVDEAGSLAKLEAKLAELYKEQDPEKLAALVERYTTLAELAGRYAVVEDL